jgi:hypothetical protein
MFNKAEEKNYAYKIRVWDTNKNENANKTIFKNITIFPTPHQLLNFSFGRYTNRS